MTVGSQSRLGALLRDPARTSGCLLTAEQIDRLMAHYGMILKWNARLHLTTIVEPESFVDRHLSESIVAATRIRPEMLELWDLGSGAGLPGIPIAILRPDLDVYLVEARRAKAIFLEEAAERLDLKRVKPINCRIESLDPIPPAGAITARAVDRMEDLIPDICTVARSSRQWLVFGGEQLLCELAIRAEREPVLIRLPGSDRRFLADLRS